MDSPASENDQEKRAAKRTAGEKIKSLV